MRAPLSTSPIPVRRRSSAFFALAAVAALLLAGCGSDDGDEATRGGGDDATTTETTAAPSSGDGSTTTEGSSTETTAPAPGDDEAEGEGDGGGGGTTAPAAPTEGQLAPGDPCSLEEGDPDCIDPEGDGEGVYLVGGADCAATAPDISVCADLDGDGTAGYPDEYSDLPTCSEEVPPPCNNEAGGHEE